MKEFVDKLIERLEESVSIAKMERMESRVGKKQTIGFGLGVRSSLEIVKDLAESYHIHCEQQYMKGYEDGLESVRSMLPYEEHNNGWIPCEVRLPEDDKNRKYLVCGKSGGIYIAEFVCKSVSNNTSIGPWWSASGRYCPSPIAWQPLPPAYKKGE